MVMMHHRQMRIAMLMLLAAFALGCHDRPDERMPPAMPAQSAPPVHIQWQDWSPEIFQQAGESDRLILLDIGATWCHWCHVMDRVTYEDPEVIALLNDRFVPVRVDRDRRPLLDRAMQQRPPLLGSDRGGWPLTVLLTPSGQILFKATFLPPRADGEYGAQAGLIDILTQLDTLWRDQRPDLQERLDALDEAVKQHRAAPAMPGEPSQETVDAMILGIQKHIDPINGGLAGAPKFFHTPALALLARAGWRGDTSARHDLLWTLRAMARGGIYDQVGGGFHRYSVDDHWHVPHFEKMATDNAALLALYANAYAATGDQTFRRIARGTLGWIQRDMTASSGEFFSAQDADVGLDDDGDAFTWSVKEVQAALGDDADFAVAAYNIGLDGDMHDRPGRNVLHLSKDAAPDLQDRLDQLTARLLEVRRQRPQPAIDETVFTDINGAFIDAHLTAWEKLGDEQIRLAALKALDALLDRQRDDRGVFAHFREGDRLVGVGSLSDQAWALRALVHAYAATTDGRYLDAATKVADFVLSDLTDDDGGLLSSPAGAGDDPAAVEPTQSWQDSPDRSAASVAAEQLLLLARLTGESRYAAAARRALATAPRLDSSYAPFVAGFALALDTSLNGPCSVLIIGPADDPLTAQMSQAARRAYLPGGFVLQLDVAVGSHQRQLELLGYSAADAPIAYVCHGSACLEPAETVEQLDQRLTDLAGQNTADGR